MKRLFVAVVAVLLVGEALALGLLPALAQSDGDGEPVVLRLGTTNSLDSLNPFKAVEIPSFELFALQYNLLVEFSQKDLSPTPGLADSWETSEDGLTWTYHLNEDAVWHDGERVTSEDVEYTFERSIEEKQALFIDYLRQIDTIETPDEHTVVITTREPSVQMLSMWIPILPKHVWEDVPGDETKTFENEPSIGSGPFQAVEWRRSQFLRLVRNEDYFRGSSHIDEIVLQFFDNPDTMVQAFKQGEVDYIDNIPVNLFNSLEGEPNIETVSSPDAGFTELGFNVYEPGPEYVEDFGAPETSTGHPALLDVRVRQAINWAIDEESLTDTILKGQGTVGRTIVPPLLAKYHLALDDSEVMGFDPDRARSLLAEAGWEDTDDDGTVDKDGEALSLRLYARSESTDTVKAANFIKDWLSEVGIDVRVKAVSDNTLTDDIYKADFDMFIWGWGSDPDPDFILSILTCAQIMGWSDTFWCDPRYDELYQLQKTQLDVDERAETIREMQSIVYEASPYVLFFYDNALEAYRTDRFTGWVRQPEGTGALIAPAGAQYTPLSLQPVSEAEAAAAAEKQSGGSPGLFVLAGVVGIVLVAVVAARLRRGSEEDRA